MRRSVWEEGEKRRLYFYNFQLSIPSDKTNSVSQPLTQKNNIEEMELNNVSNRPPKKTPLERVQNREFHDAMEGA